MKRLPLPVEAGVGRSRAEAKPLTCLAVGSSNPLQQLASVGFATNQGHAEHLRSPSRYAYFTCNRRSSALLVPPGQSLSFHHAAKRWLAVATQTPAEKTLVQGRGVVARFSTTPEERLRLAAFYVRHFSLRTPAGSLRLIGPTGQAEEVPAELYSVLRAVLQHLKEGQEISLIPNDTLLTTQQAAQLLNISRPYLYKLIDAGEIPFSKIGSHRRLKLCDVEDLRERRRVESRKALEAIAALEDDNYDYFEDYGETTRE
ncbi:MAG: hypothetical protein DCF18_10055 [Cyanobium sp.]|nr:MAG: hypothetical protein DCF18_10055 [Cyanobium sp.]